MGRTTMFIHTNYSRRFAGLTSVVVLLFVTAQSKKTTTLVGTIEAAQVGNGFDPNDTKAVEIFVVRERLRRSHIRHFLWGEKTAIFKISKVRAHKKGWLRLDMSFYGCRVV